MNMPLDLGADTMLLPKVDYRDGVHPSWQNDPPTMDELTSNGKSVKS